MTDAPPTRIPLRGGDEYDALTRWRRALCYTQRPGVCRSIKRGYQRRLRHLARAMLRHAGGDDE